MNGPPDPCLADELIEEHMLVLGRLQEIMRQCAELSAYILALPGVGKVVKERGISLWRKA